MLMYFDDVYQGCLLVHVLLLPPGTGSGYGLPQPLPEVRHEPLRHRTWFFTLGRTLRPLQLVRRGPEGVIPSS